MVVLSTPVVSSPFSHEETSSERPGGLSKTAQRSMKRQLCGLGCCSLAPVMMIRSSEEDETYGNLTKDSVKQILAEIKGRTQEVEA